MSFYYRKWYDAETRAMAADSSLSLSEVRDLYPVESANMRRRWMSEGFPAALAESGGVVPARARAVISKEYPQAWAAFVWDVGVYTGWAWDWCGRAGRFRARYGAAAEIGGAS